MQANQELFGSFPGHIILYVAFAAVLALFLSRLYRLYSLVRLGKEEDRLGDIKHRIVSTLGIVFGQSSCLKNVSLKDGAGIGHAMMFWTGLLFFVNYAYILVWGVWHEGSSLTMGSSLVSSVFASLLDVFSILCACAVIWALIRRYVIRPKRLEGGIEAGAILIMVFLLVVTHLAGEAARIALVQGGSGGVVSSAMSGVFAGLDASALTISSRVLWWLHMGIVLAFLAYIPFSKHLHILVAPVNVFLRSLRPKGALPFLDVEESKTLGAGRIEDFTWKTLLDLYACAKCGMCEDSCPAHLSGKPLSPKVLLEKLKVHLSEKGARAEAGRALIGEVVSEEEIWACTTCGACQQVCPVFNEHMEGIIQLRRNLVMEKNKTPETVGRALRTLMTRGDPFAGAGFLRTDWFEGLGIKPMAEDSRVEVLLWAGCTSALDDRGMKVLASMARLLKSAGVSFGVLGDEESCCGDPARRLGHEILFEMQARRNIETMRQYEVNKVVTCCPHCFNTMKNEYPQLGAEFEVVHHTEFIAALIKQGRLKPVREVRKRLTYHDACYLGRYNGIYEAPREILRNVPGLEIVEMNSCREKSFCCGAGGGRMWLEDTLGERMNERRAAEAIETGAEAVVTACPFCLQMFMAGIGRVEERSSVESLDVVELIERSLPAAAGCASHALFTGIPSDRLAACGV